MNERLEPSGYAESEAGPGLCARCGQEWDDHWQSDGVVWCSRAGCDGTDWTYTERDPDDAAWNAACERANV